MPEPTATATAPTTTTLSTDEERLRRLSSALCTMWAMVNRGIWPHSMLKRYLPPQILTALPPVAPGRPTTLEASRTTGVLVDVHSSTRAAASAVIWHPDGPAEAVALAYRRSHPAERWHIDQFIPIRYRHLQVALAHADPPPDPDQHPIRIRDDLRAVLGDPPPDPALRADWYQAAGHLLTYAHEHAITDLAADLNVHRRHERLDGSRALAARVTEQYRALAARAGVDLRPDDRRADRRHAGPELEL